MNLPVALTFTNFPGKHYQALPVNIKADTVPTVLHSSHHRHPKVRLLPIVDKVAGGYACLAPLLCIASNKIRRIIPSLG